MPKSEVQKTHELILKKNDVSNKDWEAKSSMKLLNAFMNGSDKNLKDKVLDVLRSEEIDQYISESLLDRSTKVSHTTRHDSNALTNKETKPSFEG